MFVKRSIDGQILAISKEELTEFNEQVDDNDEELIKFLSNFTGPQQKQLVNTDQELVRVIEDLIHLLTDKGVIQFTDLPSAAQRKLLSRKSLRIAINHLDLVEQDNENETIHL